MPIRFTWMGKQYEIVFRAFTGEVFIPATGETATRDITVCAIYRGGSLAASTHTFRCPTDEPDAAIGQYESLRRLTRKSIPRFRDAARQAFRSALRPQEA